MHQNVSSLTVQECSICFKEVSLIDKCKFHKGAWIWSEIFQRWEWYCEDCAKAKFQQSRLAK